MGRKKTIGICKGLDNAAFKHPLNVTDCSMHKTTWPKAGAIIGFCAASGEQP